MSDKPAQILWVFLKAIIRAVPVELTFFLIKIFPKNLVAKFAAQLNFLTVFEVSICNCHFKVISGPSDDHYIDLERNRLASWEEETLKIWLEHASRANLCIDVGAYTGIYSLLSPSAGSKNTIAIEPNMFTFSHLLQNIQINNFMEKITPLNCSLGLQTGRSTLYIPFERPLSSGATHNTAHLLGSKSDITKLEVDMQTIDKIVEDFQGKVDLIKIDVEGFECEVIGGSMKVLSRFKPTLIVEISDEARKKRIDIELLKLGYSPGVLIGDKRNARNYLFKVVARY